jgi:hypothetical protein
LEKTDLKGPLVQFQAVKANQKDTLLLMHTINKALGKNALDPAMLDKAFERWWPDLDQALQRIDNLRPQDEADRRSDRDLMEEVLERVRSLERTPNPVGKDDAAQTLMTWLLWRQAFKPGEEIKPLMDAVAKGELPTEIFNLRPLLRSLLTAVARGELPAEVFKVNEDAVEAAIEQGYNIPGVAITVYTPDRTRVLGEVYFNQEIEQWEVKDVPEVKFRTSREAIDWLLRSS